MAVGSLAGDGDVFLGSRTLVVGGNNLSSAFAGVIQNGGIRGGSGGALIKSGTGTLTFSGASTNSGVTTINAGALKLANQSGSATGTGAVQLNAGTLGGLGAVTGSVTAGTGNGGGAFITPSVGSSQPATFTSKACSLSSRRALRLQTQHPKRQGGPSGGQRRDHRERGAIQL